MVSESLLGRGEKPSIVQTSALLTDPHSDFELVLNLSASSFVTGVLEGFTYLFTYLFVYFSRYKRSCQLIAGNVFRRN